MACQLRNNKQLFLMAISYNSKPHVTVLSDFFSACAYQGICGGKIMMSLHLESCLLLAEIVTECKDQNIACAIFSSLVPMAIKDRTYW